MPVLGGVRLTPSVGNTCCVDTCGEVMRLSTYKAVGGFPVYLTLCHWCEGIIRRNLEICILLLPVDEEEAIVGQVMQE